LSPIRQLAISAVVVDLDEDSMSSSSSSMNASFDNAIMDVVISMNKTKTAVARFAML
jgi:hypothetical protein